MLATALFFLSAGGAFVVFGQNAMPPDVRMVAHTSCKIEHTETVGWKLTATAEYATERYHNGKPWTLVLGYWPSKIKRDVDVGEEKANRVCNQWLKAVREAQAVPIQKEKKER